MDNLFYLENKERGCVGNSIQWWKIGDSGYTCDIRAARKFTEDEVAEIKIGNKFEAHLTDWIDKLVQYHVDVQDVRAGRMAPHTLPVAKRD